MEKILIVADMRALEKQVLQGDISYTRMIEIINEKAFIQLCNGIKKHIDEKSKLLKKIEDLKKQNSRLKINYKIKTK